MVFLCTKSSFRFKVARNTKCSDTAGDTENHAVSILNQITLSFNGTYNNDFNTTGLYADPSVRADESVCLWALDCWDCGSVSCDCCGLSDIGLCDGLIHRPKNSYRMCVDVCVRLIVCLILFDQVQLKPLHLRRVGRNIQTRQERKAGKMWLQ